ncbi:MAG: type IX secretion system membrane protein PorP/SprF [Bacteroidetes bacterium]|nr:type IX secretion system membrane protein PorP/SprF [Bacteroidota bacterium]MBU1717945.1 type IX secretion system membrane protein PorP/SprF [Bacteroidota bacterium]
MAVSIRSFFFVVAFLFSGLQGFGQQEPPFSNYESNLSIFNPALTGAEYKNFVTLVGRNQWIDFPHHPVTYSAVVESKWTAIRSGIGLNFLYDQLGFEESNHVYLNYAYHHPLRKNRSISGGIAFGVYHNHIEIDSLVSESSFFGTIEDPLLQQDPSGSVWMGNAGLLYRTYHVTVGFSLSQIALSRATGFINPVVHCFFFAKYEIPLSYELKITPEFIYRTDQSSYLNEFGLSIKFRNFWMGGSLRNSSTWVGKVGVDIQKKFRIGYAYDYFTPDPSRFGPTHEVVLGFVVK